MTADAIEIPSWDSINETLVRRFWSKVAIRDDSECWLWKAQPDRLGYGQFSWNGKTYRSHRLAYWMWHGKWFSPDVKLRHSCDERVCCNPAHLVPGTQADNMEDRRVREGYRTMARGENHGHAKLRADDVRAIRAAPDAIKSLASRYGVSEAQISRIRNGQVWRWLP